jgi:hypothetical protein
MPVIDLEEMLLGQPVIAVEQIQGMLTPPRRRMLTSEWKALNEPKGTGNPHHPFHLLSFHLVLIVPMTRHSQSLSPGSSNLPISMDLPFGGLDDELAFLGAPGPNRLKSNFSERRKHSMDY